MKLRTLGSCGLVVFLGCTGTSSNLPPNTPHPANGTPPSPATRSIEDALDPSTDIARLWPFPGPAREELHGNLGGFFHTTLGQALVSIAVGAAGRVVSAPDLARIRSGIDAVEEVAVGVDENRGVVLVRFNEATFDVASAMTALGWRKMPWEGRDNVYGAGGSEILVHERGLIVAGTDELVRAALHRSKGAAALPASLALGPDEYLALDIATDERTKVSAKLLASSERFLIRATADIPADEAARIEEQYRIIHLTGLGAFLPSDQGALVKSVLSAVDLQRDGGHLVGTFDLHEPPADQARDLGMLAVVSIAGVRKYIAEAKAAEARINVGQLAKEYASWWAHEDEKKTPRAKRKLVSFPAVPARVPEAAKYQSSPADWAAWAPIHFTLDGPQYYQYEVRAAKDGESAEIRAQGDLDGNGKTSLFKLTVTIDRKHKSALVVPDVIEETDPTE